MKGRGFAAKSVEERRAIGRKGGLASQAGAGRKRHWTKEQAREAGVKGGRRKRATP